MSSTGVPGSSKAEVTVPGLLDKHARGERLVMITAYDHPSARLVDEAGVDMILVGDSLAMVVLGYDSTLPVTMDEMLHHARAVARGARRALLIGDMPFMSFQTGPRAAVRNAGRFLQEGGMNAVKLEGGRAVAASVRALCTAGIPVMGHIGLTPQHIHALGGYRVQGKSAAAARTLLADALALERAGCFAVVIEVVPARLAAYISARLEIPTIGIGAGAGTDGQVLVFHDLLGLWHGRSPRFVKRYGELGRDAARAIAAFCQEVEAGVFPDDQHAYTMSDPAWQAFLDVVEVEHRGDGEKGGNEGARDDQEGLP